MYHYILRERADHYKGAYTGVGMAPHPIQTLFVLGEIALAPRMCQEHHSVHPGMHGKVGTTKAI